jgi:hypothetical protein
MRNNFSEFLLSPTGFQLDGQTLRLPVRLPWYRALPLSVFEVGSLIVDRVNVPVADIRLIVNGHTCPASSLGNLTEEWWYVLDDAILEARLPPLPASSTHAVDFTLKLFPPYIPGLAWVTQARREYRAA